MTSGRYREVHSPARSDGVGAALRRAFVTHEGSADFLSLIEELDRKTQV